MPCRRRPLAFACLTAAPPAVQRHLHPCRNLSLEPLSARDAELLVERARMLHRLGDAAHKRSLLRGKNLGLLCESGDSEEARRFCRAATDLGARVSHLRPDLSRSSSDSDVGDTGRMMGHLYDGIECLGLDKALVRRLGSAANVPVYDGISSSNHAVAKLADQLGTADGLDERHRLIVQAILLRTLSHAMSITYWDSKPVCGPM